MSFCPWSITLPGAEFALAPERPLVHRSSIPISHTRTLIFLGLALLGALFSSPHHASATPVASDAPREVVLPADDASHRELIEWWYYTGHLETASGDRYGFQFVVFEGEFGPLAGVVSHVAVTDMEREIHVYDQRVDYGRHPAPDGPGFAFSLDDWSMQGSDGKDRLRAALDGIAFDLALTPEKPPALHDGDGYIAYDNGEYSYYYSRTRMAIEGTLTADGRTEQATGQAWFDHQWGNFSTFRTWGWDWFALQLDDGSDLMLYVVLDENRQPRFIDGSLIDAEGNLSVLDAGDFTIDATGSWTSPDSGITYPSGWRISVPAHDLALDVTPVFPDQELDTLQTTGIIYWAGAVEIAGSRGDAPVSGVGYVELTGDAGAFNLSGSLIAPTT
jgi:predicted secreted hydrolase